jgi:hypothetical protein
MRKSSTAAWSVGIDRTSVCPRRHYRPKSDYPLDGSQGLSRATPIGSRSAAMAMDSLD